MPLLSLLLWGGLLLAVLGAWVCSGGAWFLGWRRRWPILKWSAAVACAFLTLIVAFGIVVFGYGCVRTSVPRYVFEDTFHRKPPPGTEVLHGKSGGFADSAGISLAFRTNRETFDSIRPEQLHRGTLADYLSKAATMPKWWRHPDEKSEIWLSESSPRTFATKPPDQKFYSELTIMTWDPDGLVQYEWWGID